MAAEKLTRVRFIQLLVVLMILLALIAWRTWSYYDSRAQQQADVTAVKGDSSTLCNLNEQACVIARNSHGEVTLALSPVPPVAESELQLRLSGLSTTEIPSGVVEGRDMYMGLIPLLFVRQGDDWVASFQVGSCTSDKMVWRVDLSIAEKSYSVLFDVVK